MVCVMMSRFRSSHARFAALGFAALLLGTAPARDAQAPYPEPPQALFGDLFVAVQTARVFADGKEFADAIPTTTPERILADYQEQKPATPTDLKHFVDAHFSLPPPIAPLPILSGQETMVAHIDRLWTLLTRSTPSAPPHSSLLTLPHPYVVPGGRFREMYYWDSYFTMLGLMQSGRADLARDMVRDFAYLIDSYGHIPNGARTYYLSRSQPPFFFAMVGLLAADDPAASYAEYLPQLRREHAFWMRGSERLRAGTAGRRVVAMDDGSLLNRYWDDRDTPRDESFREDTDLARASGREPHQLFRDIRAAAESGWDFGSRWFADGRTLASLDTTEIVPVDLNSLMFGLEQAIAAGCARTRDANCARDFGRRAARRRGALDRYLWDSRTGAYLDYRWPRHERVPRLSAATLYPLFVGAASESQASSVGAVTQRDLLKPGGIVTTPLRTGQQWDSPNGWPPLQWIAVDGLRRYGQRSLAAAIACRWMSGVNHVYEESGKLVEKYDVMDTGRKGGGGEYPTQDGFGWTNGVMRKLLALYPENSAYDAAARCAARPP
jgi:alpha,alpha-trehalase